MIERNIIKRLRDAAHQFPAITLTGPRQSGKSTLCRHLFPHLPYVNLESPNERSLALEDPLAFLARYPQGAVIDEIQRAPELPSYLQAIIDENPQPGRWILTGSQNLSLLQSVNQSLAGRTAILQLLPMTHDEMLGFQNPPRTLNETMLLGGYPRILDQGIDRQEWMSSYVGTYIERDVRTIANVGDLVAFQRFLELCAGRTAQLLNYSSLADDCGISQPTAKAWLNVLETSFILHRLPAFHTNLRKRVVKMPKLHFYDSGLVCWLLGIHNVDQLASHPLRGSIFESWVVSEIIKHRTNSSSDTRMYFYRDNNLVEADVVLGIGRTQTIVEVKSSMTANANILDGARRVRGLLMAPSIDFKIRVVYGGDDFQERSDALIIPWNLVHEQEWS